MTPTISLILYSLGEKFRKSTHKIQQNYALSFQLDTIDSVDTEKTHMETLLRLTFILLVELVNKGISQSDDGLCDGSRKVRAEFLFKMIVSCDKKNLKVKQC